MSGLVEKLEAASAEDAWVFAPDVHLALFGGSLAQAAKCPPYTTSLDAALALAERVGLDGWNTLYAAMMSWKAHDPRGPLSRYLPLSLCIAILRALNLNETRHD